MCICDFFACIYTRGISVHSFVRRNDVGSVQRFTPEKSPCGLHNYMYIHTWDIRNDVGSAQRFTPEKSLCGLRMYIHTWDIGS